MNINRKGYRTLFLDESDAGKDTTIEVIDHLNSSERVDLSVYKDLKEIDLSSRTYSDGMEYINDRLDGDEGIKRIFEYSTPEELSIPIKIKGRVVGVACAEIAEINTYLVEGSTESAVLGPDTIISSIENEFLDGQRQISDF